MVSVVIPVGGYPSGTRTGAYNQPYTVDRQHATGLHLRVPPLGSANVYLLVLRHTGKVKIPRTDRLNNVD